MRRKGFFITFEGIDGSGKTTQLKLTEKYLKNLKYEVLSLREPGSTPLSERIRRILLDKRLNINSVSELLLYVSARAELVEQVITPALDAGKIVLCDRFYDSTVAYQGYGRKLDIDWVRRVNRAAVGEYIPDLTFLVDITYRKSMERRKQKSDRLEAESKAFFSRVRKGFLEIASRERRRVIILDGKKSPEKIFEEVKECLRKRLSIKMPRD